MISTIRRRLGRRSGLLGFLALTLAVGACDWFEDPSPDVVGIELVEGAGAYEVIVSTVFVAGLNELGGTRVELIESDTLVVTTPYMDDVDIRGDQRFFIRVLAAGAEADVGTVRLRVDIDDESRFDRRAEVTAEPMFFLYQFNGQIFTEDIQVF